MQLDFSKQFRKQYHKLPQKLQAQTDERLRHFAEVPTHPFLHNHQLHGAYGGCRSINITGDYRAVFVLSKPDLALFIAVGTHHELFGS